MGYGRPIGVGLILALIFVALPLAFIYAISSMLVENGMDPAEYFHGTQTYILIFGILLTVFGAMTSYFEKGSTARLGTGIIGAIFLILWGYFFIDSMSIFYEGDTYSYEVLVPGIAAILALAFSFRLIYRIVEFLVYRKEFSAVTVPGNAYPSNSGWQEDAGANYPGAYEDGAYSGYDEGEDEEHYF